MYHDTSVCKATVYHFSQPKTRDEIPSGHAFECGSSLESGLACNAQPPAVDPDKEYQLTEESLQRSDSVTQGTIEEHVWKSTGVFAGTVRRIWIYAPAKEHLDSLGTQGAAVMVFQDGHAYIDEAGQFRVPIVFDNLIHSGEMPPTIGIFIDPGHTSDSLPGDKPGWQPPPNNRSLEYDTLSSAYATFLIEEILPFAATRYRLTDDPSWRAICGISSGGICALQSRGSVPIIFRKLSATSGALRIFAVGMSIHRSCENQSLSRNLSEPCCRMANKISTISLEIGGWPILKWKRLSALLATTIDSLVALAATTASMAA